MGLVEHWSLSFTASGFVVGFLVGMVGVGGGSLMTPLLVLAFGVPPAAAVGTDLLFAAATKSLGTVVHHWSGTVDWRVTLRLAAGSLPSAGLTLLILALLGPHDAAATRLITLVLGIALIVTAVALLLRNRLQAVTPILARDGPAAIWGTIGTGALLGAVVAASSVGAGALGMVALVMLYPGLPTARLVGSDIAHAVPLTLLAGFGHWMMGSVQWELLAMLLTGSLPGIGLGSLIPKRLPDRVLRPALAVLLIFVGAKLLA